MRQGKMVCNYEIKDCIVVCLHMDAVTLSATIASYCQPWPLLTGLFLVSLEGKTLLCNLHGKFTEPKGNYKDNYKLSS